MNTIATIIDDRYFKYIIPWRNSLTRNYPTYPNLLIYHANLNKRQLDYLSSFERIRLRVINLEKDAIGPTNHRMSSQTYAKYLYFLDNTYDKILHIDPDTLILKPLDDLFNYNDFFSVTDGINTTTFKNTETILKKIILKAMLLKDSLVQNSKYITNVGVLLIPRKYRTKENYDYMVYLTKKYFRYLKHRDQSVINMWMWKNGIRPTDKIEYDYQVRFFKMPDKKMPISDIYILHFLGENKPDTEWFRDRYDKEIVHLYDYYCSIK